MIVKTFGSQMGSPAAAEGRGEAMGEGRGESEEQTKNTGLAHTHKGNFLVSHISVPDEHLCPVDHARLDPVDLQCVYFGCVVGT